MDSYYGDGGRCNRPTGEARLLLRLFLSNQYDMLLAGIRVRQTSGQNLDDIVRAAREFVRRNVNA